MDTDPAHTPLTGLDPETLDKLRRGFPLHMSRQGHLSFEGDPISHPGVVRVLRENLDLSESGEVIIEIQSKWVYLKLDDLPLRALRVDTSELEAGVLCLVLDDGRQLPLDPATLWEEPELGLRCEVPARGSGRPLAVRFTNTAALDLSQAFVWPDESVEDARPRLDLGAGRSQSIPSTRPR